MHKINRVDREHLTLNFHPQLEKASGLMAELQGSMWIVLALLALPVFLAIDIMLKFKGAMVTNLLLKLPNFAR